MSEQEEIHCPIAYGSIAHWFGRKADEAHTHQWTLFVRGPNGEDLTYFVSKVVFTLHPSFAQPVREIFHPPFEVTEKGWGEFEATIRLYFHDTANGMPMDITHPIRLYPQGNTAPTVKKPVVHEFYDEIVFTNPAKELADRLRRGPEKQAPTHNLQDNFTVFDESPDIEALTAAQKFITDELNKAKEEISLLDVERNALRERLAGNVEGKKVVFR